MDKEPMTLSTAHFSRVETWAEPYVKRHQIVYQGKVLVVEKKPLLITSVIVHIHNRDSGYYIEYRKQGDKSTVTKSMPIILLEKTDYGYKIACKGIEYTVYYKLYT